MIATGCWISCSFVQKQALLFIIGFFKPERHDMKPMTILIAGPYRSGTEGDLQRIARNLRTLEEAAWQVYARGHVPLIGEWLALPLAQQAGHGRVAEYVPSDFLYEVARRVIDRCDAVYRIPGESRGADGDVRQARELGLPVYFSVDEVPVATGLERPEHRPQN
jgi:hypothetical protein